MHCKYWQYIYTRVLFIHQIDWYALVIIDHVHLARKEQQRNTRPAKVCVCQLLYFIPFFLSADVQQHATIKRENKTGKIKRNWTSFRSVHSGWRTSGIVQESSVRNDPHVRIYIYTHGLYTSMCLSFGTISYSIWRIITDVSRNLRLGSGTAELFTCALIPYICQ